MFVFLLFCIVHTFYTEPSAQVYVCCTRPVHKCTLHYACIQVYICCSVYMMHPHSLTLLLFSTELTETQHCLHTDQWECSQFAHFWEESYQCQYLTTLHRAHFLHTSVRSAKSVRLVGVQKVSVFDNFAQWSLFAYWTIHSTVHIVAHTVAP